MAGLVYAFIFSGIISLVITAPVEDVQVTVIDVGSASLNENVLLSDVTLIGDVQIDPHRNAVLNNKRWTNGEIPYVIDSSYSSAIHDGIIAGMREIEHDVNPTTGAACIKFVARTTQANYIHINKGTGCHSIIGMTNKGMQDVSIGAGCESKGIVMHELIHTIGFWHEQSRSDRNNYVNINLTNVPDDEKHDFQLLSSSSSNNLNMAYDFGSIMHYGPYEFTMDKTVPVITPKSGLGHGVQMGQRLALSKSDVTKIQRLYGCTEDTSHVTTPLATNNVMIECSFESSLCTLQSDLTADFQWTRKSGVSNAGPKVGNTNGADPYLVATAAGHHGTARVTTPSYSKGPVCIDFFLYQPGPSSYLSLVVFGPHVARQTFKTYQNTYHDRWYHYRLYFNIAQDTVYQVSFEAHINAGDVAIDDINIYHGQCM